MLNTIVGLINSEQSMKLHCSLPHSQCPMQAAVLEMTWVVSDYTATPGTSEVSVTKGQQVEIIDTACSGAPDFCLVRLNAQGSGSGANGADAVAQEGLVPLSVLKLAPSKGAHRRNVDGADMKEHPENSGEYRSCN